MRIPRPAIKRRQTAGRLRAAGGSHRQSRIDEWSSRRAPPRLAIWSSAGAPGESRPRRHGRSDRTRQLNEQAYGCQPRLPRPLELLVRARRDPQTIARTSSVPPIHDQPRRHATTILQGVRGGERVSAHECTPARDFVRDLLRLASVFAAISKRRACSVMSPAIPRVGRPHRLGTPAVAFPGDAATPRAAPGRRAGPGRPGARSSPLSGACRPARPRRRRG